MSRKNLELLIVVAALLLPSYVDAQTSPRRTFVHNETIKQEYDRFKDLTSVSMTTQLIGDKRAGLALILVETFIGQTATPKKTYERLPLLFMSTGSNKKYARSDTLIILANGERFSAGESIYYDDTPLSGRHVELINFVFPYETFRKILTAKKVEAQIGETEFTFTDQQLEALRDFYSRIVP